MSLLTNLLAYWNMDGNSNDSLGGFNGTDTSISYSAGNGKIVQGAGFNATTSKIILGTGSLSICPSSGDFTISAWIKLTNINKNQAIFGRPDQHKFVVTNANKLDYLVENPSRSNTYEATGATSLAAATWYHVVAVFKASTSLTVYLNGSSDGSFSTSVPATVYDQTAQNVAIGALDNSPYVQFIDGDIDEVGVWSRALSGAEITSLYNSGSGLAYPFRISFIAQPNGLVTKQAVRRASFI